MSKLTFKLMIFTLCLSLAVVSCKKDKDEPDPPKKENNNGGDNGGNGNGGGNTEPYVKNLSFIARKGTAADSIDLTKSATIQFTTKSKGVNEVVVYGETGSGFPSKSLRIRFFDTLRVGHKYSYSKAFPSKYMPIVYTEKLNSTTTNQYKVQGGYFMIDSIDVADKFVKGHFSITAFNGPSAVNLEMGKFELKE